MCAAYAPGCTGALPARLPRRTHQARAAGHHGGYCAQLPATAFSAKNACAPAAAACAAGTSGGSIAWQAVDSQHRRAGANMKGGAAGCMSGGCGTVSQANGFERIASCCKPPLRQHVPPFKNIHLAYDGTRRADALLILPSTSGVCVPDDSKTIDARARAAHAAPHRGVSRYLPTCHCAACAVCAPLRVSAAAPRAILRLYNVEDEGLVCACGISTIGL